MAKLQTRTSFVTSFSHSRAPLFTSSEERVNKKKHYDLGKSCLMTPETIAHLVTQSYIKISSILSIFPRSYSPSFFLQFVAFLFSRQRRGHGPRAKESPLMADLSGRGEPRETTASLIAHCPRSDYGLDVSMPLLLQSR